MVAAKGLVVSWCNLSNITSQGVSNQMVSPARFNQSIMSGWQTDPPPVAQTNDSCLDNCAYKTSRSMRRKYFSPHCAKKSFTLMPIFSSIKASVSTKGIPFSSANCLPQVVLPLAMKPTMNIFWCIVCKYAAFFQEQLPFLQSISSFNAIISEKTIWNLTWIAHEKY